MSTTAIYHKSDFDGIFCREIARKFLPHAELIGWEYGEPEPVVPRDANLYILDLSVPGLMDHPRLVWIDHHASAIAKYPASIPGYRIDGVAACRLAWHWFTADARLKEQSLSPEKHAEWMAKYPLANKQDFIDRKLNEPLAVQLAGEYDVWDKRDPKAELFQHGLRSRELNENMWDLLLVPQDSHPDGVVDCGTITVRALLEAGEAIAYAATEHNAKVIANNGFTVQWEGLTFLACNNGSYNSHLFTAGIKPEHDALLGFTMRANRKWTVSLYGVPGKPDIDLAAIAVKHGGGGHKQACGFACDVLPFI